MNQKFTLRVRYIFIVSLLALFVIKNHNVNVKRFLTISCESGDIFLSSFKKSIKLSKMGDVTLETIAYAKIMLHASKYRHCAVNGVLIANATKNRDGAKNQDLEIVDTIPLFHHSHYVSPMAEIALTQIENAAQADNKVIAGYYAGCENFRDNTVEACPGQKIAEKIVEYFPSAVFIVIDNKKVMEHLETPAIKLHRYIDGKWKQREINMKTLFSNPDVLKTVSYLLEWGVEKDLIDFDNYLDDITQDWTNQGIEKLLAMTKKYTDNKKKSKE